jgi:translation initiation factor 1
MSSTVIFANTSDFELESKKNPVHLRLQQRNGKKCITIVEGLAPDLDLKKIAKALRQSYSTSCSVVKDKENNKGDILQLAGDHRNNVQSFLTITNICTEKQIKKHGI